MKIREKMIAQFYQALRRFVLFSDAIPLNEALPRCLNFVGFADSLFLVKTRLKNVQEPFLCKDGVSDTNQSVGLGQSGLESGCDPSYSRKVLLI